MSTVAGADVASGLERNLRAAVGPGFRFRRLELTGIDNRAAIDRLGAAAAKEEVCAFAEEVESGDEYVERLRALVVDAIGQHRPLPVVRFADGEFLFYRGSMRCNALYAQAESTDAIERSLAGHVDALRRLAATGVLAPLVCARNVEASPAKQLLKRIARRDEGSSLRFLRFLRANGAGLTPSTYVPFYAVYGYLSSPAFAADVDGRRVCVLNSAVDLDAVGAWFAERGSRPRLAAVEIPAEYVATRWSSMRDEVLAALPDDVELSLVGAGIGALGVCTDVADATGAPAIDAGHVLNLMNDQALRSGGEHRLFVHPAPT